MIWPEPPQGFTRRVDGTRAVYVDAGDERAFASARLDRWESWEDLLAGAPGARGRGATAVLATDRGAWRLKRMRRGGLTARVWRDLYPGASRLVKILDVAATAVRRRLPTARPVGLLVESSAGPLVRAWMASEEIPGCVNAADRLARRELSQADLAALLKTIRAFHEAGIVHPDLNLGNVLLRVAPAGAEAFVIDLDRATAHPGPAPISARIDALRRLERSCAKITGSPAPLGPGSDELWYSLYAGSDADLSRELLRSRTAGRALLAWHRLGWK